MANCVSNKHDEVTKITRALVKNMKYPTEDTLFSDLWFLIKSHWIERLFNGNGEEKQNEQIREPWRKLSYYGHLGEALRPIIRQIISEQPKEKEDDEEESADDD